ncbi:MAG: multicopper oxidase domain-containing protein [Spirochaetaceae bacterium]|nr:MAG: multicopper oxidase domain-containing protein [Spirochaetaceae bacterium]
MRNSNPERYRNMPPWGLLLCFLALAAYPLSALEPVQKAFDQPLPIPPLMTGTRAGGETIYELTAKTGSRILFQDTDTPTYGYNGEYLGPTLRLRRGDQVRIRVHNSLEETTTVHWHGMEVPGPADGGPHQGIRAGAGWEARFTVDQPAATLWYHPHPLGHTARQVYMGLAGLIIIEDETSDSLGIPKSYGSNDIPLVIQDRRFQADGSFSYGVTMPDLMHGLVGDTYLVNGAIKPALSVGKELLRFRLLNGSNSSIYRFSFSDDSSFAQIASDGGFLKQPVGMSTLILSPGERAEILVDLQNRTAGESLFLITETFQGFRDEVLKIVVESEQSDSGKAGNPIPKRLTSIAKIPEANARKTRHFDLETMGRGGMGMMGGGGLTINGRKMDMRRIDAEVQAGSTEVWELFNTPTGMMEIPHSFHLHGVQFQILDINGKAPPSGESGWKDTVLLWPGDRVRIIIPFREFPGIYMYHCHLLEHEDEGMMGQFEVVP